MTQPKSPHSFPDCRAFMDKAIASKLGTRIIFKEKGKATNFRFRCYTARHREKARNLKIYKQEDILYGATVWDKLIFPIYQREPDGRWVMEAIHDEEAALRSVDGEVEDIRDE